MQLVAKFVAGLFAPIAASVRRTDEEYFAAEVKRQRLKEIVGVMHVSHAQELPELDVSEWPPKMEEQQHMTAVKTDDTSELLCPGLNQGGRDLPLSDLEG